MGGLHDYRPCVATSCSFGTLNDLILINLGKTNANKVITKTAIESEVKFLVFPIDIQNWPE